MHWDDVYLTRRAEGVIWYRRTASLSLELILGVSTLAATPALEIMFR